MTYRSIISIALLIVFCGSNAMAKRPAPRKKGVKSAILRYQGKLADDKGKPVSGVFQIRFALYDRIKSGRHLWQSTSYIFVNEGSYVVDLGQRQRLNKTLLAKSQLFLGIKVGDSEEYREKLSLPSPAPVIDTPTPSAPTKGIVSFALRAGTADKLSGLTLPQLITKVKQELHSTTTPGGVYFQMPQVIGGVTRLACRQGYVLSGLILKDGKIVKGSCSKR